LYETFLPFTYKDLKTLKKINNHLWLDKNNVYYYDNYDGDVKKVKGADAKTFEAIEGYALGRDKNAVHDKGKMIKGLDPVTFEDLNGDFYKDKNGVYVWENRGWKKLEELDPITFQIINVSGSVRQYLKDKNGINSDSVTIQNFFSANTDIGGNTVRTIYDYDAASVAWFSGLSGIILTTLLYRPLSHSIWFKLLWDKLEQEVTSKQCVDERE